MNKKAWNQLYKVSSEGKKCIELFNPEVEDILKASCDIVSYSAKWGGSSVDFDMLEEYLWLLANNLEQRKMLPEVWDKEAYMKFIEEFEIHPPKVGKDRKIEYTDEGQLVFNEEAYIIKKDQYRLKASNIQNLSLLLFYLFDFFKPMLLPQRFDVILKNCNSLGIEMPEIPRTNDYRGYLEYYYDICSVWNEFQKENELTDAELCACIYDFAPFLQEESEKSELPKPTNVWLTGAGAKNKGDFDFLDTLGKDSEKNGESVWACNERTRRGDIIVVYCNTPRSYIHSIWRSNSGGIFNPFDYYHCRTTICDGILVPHITFNELRTDDYMSNVPIVRKGLRGINGVGLTSKDYAEILRMIEAKGGDLGELPHLYEGSSVDFGEIKLEKDVEEKILIPMLKRLGYNEADWTRQLSRKAGRKEKAIPDFVFFPVGNKHFENAPMIIEAKLDMAPVREHLKAFEQGLSYASMLHSSIMGICDKERLIIFKVDKNGCADRNNPIFENHWDAIYSDSEVGAELTQLIGREVVNEIKIEQ